MVFIANYPNEQNIREGMFQRIKAIDSHFLTLQRVYINLSFHKNLRKSSIQIDGNCILYNLNSFLHIITLLKIIKSNSVFYFHSVHNVLLAFPVLYPILKKKRIFWDVHGIMGEEAEMRQKILRSHVYNFFERIIYKKADFIIVVTNALKDYLSKKMGNTPKGEVIVYPILPSNIINQPQIDTTPCKIDTVNIIYSGNTQLWQNIDLMLSLIEKYSTKYHFFILTADLNRMNSLVDLHKIQRNRITVLSVNPSELEYYYRNAHYGFVLRDDIAVNNVACPTKVIEYMYYNIIPIVKSPNIGDLLSKDYEFIHYSELDNHMLPRKSGRNHEIINDMIRDIKKIDLLKLAIAK